MVGTNIYVAVFSSLCLKGDARYCHHLASVTVRHPSIVTNVSKLTSKSIVPKRATIFMNCPWKEVFKFYK